MVALSELMTFLKHPEATEEIQVDSALSILKIAGKSLLIIYLGALVYGIVVVPLELTGLMPSQEEIISDTASVLYVALLGPLIEELLFRLPLKLSKRNIVVFLGILVFIITGKTSTKVSILLVVIWLVIVTLLITDTIRTSSKVNSLYAKHFMFIFYLQALLFGFVHLWNFEFELKYFYLFPVYVSFYIYIGCVLGYLRIRYTNGIYICILTHVMLNSIYCIIHLI